MTERQYPPPPDVREALEQLLGQGITFVERQLETGQTACVVRIGKGDTEVRACTRPVLVSPDDDRNRVNALWRGLVCELRRSMRGAA